MVTARQVAATEQLLLALDRASQQLDQRLVKQLAKKFSAGRPSDREVYDHIFSEVLNQSGTMGKRMHAAVASAVGTTEVDFAPADLDGLGKSVSHITSVVMDAGKAYVLAGAGSAMKDLVMGQVRSSVASNARSGRRLYRVANADACQWCSERDGLPAPGGQLSHHDGCGCFVEVR